MADETSNGGAAQKGTVSQLILTLDRQSFTMTIGGATENFDEALAMLKMARREIESKLRAAQVKQVLSGPGFPAIQFPRPRGH